MLIQNQAAIGFRVLFLWQPNIDVYRLEIVEKFAHAWYKVLQLF